MIAQTHRPLSGLGDPGTSVQASEKAGLLGRSRAIHSYIRTPSTFSGIPGPDFLPTSTVTLKRWVRSCGSRGRRPLLHTVEQKQGHACWVEKEQWLSRASTEEGNGVTASLSINLFKRFMRLGRLRGRGGRLRQLLIGAGREEIPC